jgi:hypothetical protein
MDPCLPLCWRVAAQGCLLGIQGAQTPFSRTCNKDRFKIYQLPLLTCYYFECLRTSWLVICSVSALFIFVGRWERSIYEFTKTYWDYCYLQCLKFTHNYTVFIDQINVLWCNLITNYTKHVFIIYNKTAVYLLRKKQLCQVVVLWILRQ